MLLDFNGVNGCKAWLDVENPEVWDDTVVSADEPREWDRRLTVCSKGLEELEEPMLASDEVSRGLDSMPTMPRWLRDWGVTVCDLGSAPPSASCSFTKSSAMSHSAGTKSTKCPELLTLHLPPPFAFDEDVRTDRSAVGGVSDVVRLYS